MADCQQLKTQLDYFVGQREEVLLLLQEDLPASRRAKAIANLKTLNFEIDTKQAQYTACLSSAPKPDLVAESFQITLNHAARTMDVACVIRNDGDVPAQGPVKVAQSIDYRIDGVGISKAKAIQIPSGTTITGHGSKFVVDKVWTSIPLRYRDEHPDALYRLEMVVNSDHELLEEIESNNSLRLDYWTVSPTAS
jgi:hypothetical protein